MCLGPRRQEGPLAAIQSQRSAPFGLHGLTRPSSCIQPGPGAPSWAGALLRLLLAELMRGWISSQPDPLPLQPQAKVLMRGRQAAAPFPELLVVGRGTGLGSPVFPALD